MPSVRDTEDEEFEILDIRNSNWLQKMLGDITKESAAKQVGVGGITGWCAGYAFCKVGKAAAVALGGSLLLMQIAHHQGYITVNWGRVEKELNKAKKQIKRSAQSRFPQVIDEVQEFARDNIFLAGGFAAGFLIGLAT